MKNTIYYYIGIVILGVVSAVVIFASMPEDTWIDYRTDLTGVASPDEIYEKIDCLSRGGIWEYVGCSVEKPEPEQFKPHPGLGLLNQENQKNAVENNTPDQLKGILGSCSYQERVKTNPDTVERCPQSFIDWENSTHYIDNHICEWQERK